MKVIMGIDGSLVSSGIAILNGDTGEIIAYDNIPIKPKDCNGDEILKINNKRVRFQTEIIDLLQETKGEEVTVTLKRNNETIDN